MFSISWGFHAPWYAIILGRHHHCCLLWALSTITGSCSILTTTWNTELVRINTWTHWNLGSILYLLVEIHEYWTTKAYHTEFVHTNTFHTHSVFDGEERKKLNSCLTTCIFEVYNKIIKYSLVSTSTFYRQEWTLCTVTCFGRFLCLSEKFPTTGQSAWTSTHYSSHHTLGYTLSSSHLLLCFVAEPLTLLTKIIFVSEYLHKPWRII